MDGKFVSAPRAQTSLLVGKPAFSTSSLHLHKSISRRPPPSANHLYEVDIDIPWPYASLSMPYRLLLALPGH